MVADLNTISGFAFRYRAASNYVGGTHDAYTFGTSWTDDAGANALTGNSKIVMNTTRRTRTQVCSHRNNTGAIITHMYKTAGTALNVRSMGAVIVGTLSAGSTGTNRAIVGCGTTGGGLSLVIGTASDGTLSISTESYGNVINFPTLIVPCGSTCITIQSSGTATYAKVLGLSGVDGGLHTGTSNSAWMNVFSDYDTGTTNRAIGAWDELAFFSSAVTKANVAAIEADVVSRYGLTIPTAGHIICLGDSIGVGDYQGFGGVSWPTDVAEANPTWFTINRCIGGYTIADIYAARATLINVSANRPLGTTLPLKFIVEAGANDVNTSRTLLQMQTDISQLVGYIRATFPLAQIVVCTVLTIGSTAAKNTVRTGYNSWLIAGGLRAYGALVADVAGYDASFTPATNTDADVAALTGGANYQIYDNTDPPVATTDHVHPGIVGFNKITGAFKAGAAAAINAGLFRRPGGGLLGGGSLIGFGGL